MFGSSKNKTNKQSDSLASSTNQANEQINSSEQTTLRLSDDIGKMADRIGQMADRIGDMSERILETQKIQSKNIELVQQSVMEAMKIMSNQMETTNKIMELLVKKGMDIDLSDTFKNP